VINDISPKPWAFTATTTRPDGVTVRVTVSAPADMAWHGIREFGELAWMAAGRCMTDVTKSLPMDSSEVPF
jgi:hypothetical protein